MKSLFTTLALAALLTGCNAVATTADKIMNKQSSFSKQPNTHYPTVDGKKDSESAEFAKQTFDK